MDIGPQSKNNGAKRPILVDGIYPRIKQEEGVNIAKKLPQRPQAKPQAVKGALESKPESSLPKTTLKSPPKAPVRLIRPQNSQNKEIRHIFSKPKTRPKTQAEIGFFDQPLAQEYEKDKKEKSVLIKRISILVTSGLLLIALILSGISLFRNSKNVENKVFASSDQGKDYLLSAQNSLLAFDFKKANTDFNSAYLEFEKSEKELSLLGQSNILIGKVPGNGSVISSGEKLISVAKDISFAGKEITSIEGLFGNFSLLDEKEIQSWHQFDLATERLERSEKALERAQNNLLSVNFEAVPETKDLLEGIKKNLPRFREMVKLFIAFSKEAPEILGQKKPQKYLILFQNPAEARATGGFLGNYGYLSFDKGKMIGPKVEDIYKLKWLTEGKRDIIKPPSEIYEADIGLWKKSHWEIWDANWWIDFPTTAKKIEWYYNEYDQGLTEGVIAADPLVFSDILKIIGPVKLSKYGVSVNSKNFWQVMERKVEVDNPFKRGEAEYKDANPKQILKDFAPLFMEKIKNADSEKKNEITKSLYENIKRKHILLFSNNSFLQNLFSKLNWGGEVINTSKDYLYINESNVGVNKSSSRIKQSIELNVDIDEAEIKNNLKITRIHTVKKGNPLVGRNISYLRILVPQGSALNSFVIDGQDVAPRVLVGEEAGKTKFGVISRVEPEEKQIIEVTYSLPFSVNPTSITPKYYSLYVQKQPGRIEDLLNINIKVNSNYKIKSVESNKGGNFSGNDIEFISDLLEDRGFNILLSR